MALESVAVLVREGISLFEFGVAAEVFGIDRTIAGVPGIEFRVCAENGPGLVSTKHSSAVGLYADHGLDGLNGVDLVIVSAVRPALCTNAERHALQQAHQRGATVMSLCSGAFLLADAGLLNNRPCTTHWLYADQLRLQYPSLDVREDELFVDDGSIITAAGTAAAIDACLHVTRRELGQRVASIIARRMVVPPHREGGQRQYMNTPMPATTTASLGPVLDRITDDPASTHSVEQMAAHAGLSPRHFARRFHEETGTTPHRWLTLRRIAAARELLETTDLPVERIADKVGYRSPAQLRLNFERSTGLTPARYRNRFSGTQNPT